MTKILTINNFLLPDPLTGAFVHQDRDGRERHRSAVDWAHEILALSLEGEVPEGVKQRFALARCVLLYGFFWYPLWTHGVAEATRAVEAAVEAACAVQGGPKRAKDTEARIAWLVKRRVLEASDAEWWATLALLTVAAGPSAPPPLLAPVRALETLAQVADVINRLFGSPGVEADRNGGSSA